jgi:hypothetical protein
MEEVFVFGDQNEFVGGRIAPNVGVRSLAQTQVEHVLAVGTEAAQATSQSGGQLVIDEEFHDASRTG